MDETRFWSIVQQVHDRCDGDMDEKSTAIRKVVASLSSEDAIAFQRIFDTKMNDAYDFALWGAAYVMRGGCGDDAFMDFRACSISRGREAFEKALAEPDSLADDYFDDHEWFFEGYAYAIIEGVEIAAGRNESLGSPAQPKGEAWTDDELESRYPRLVVKFRSHGFAFMNVRRGALEDAHRYAVFSERVFVKTFGAQNDPSDIAEYLAKTFGAEHQSRALADPKTTVLLAESGGEIIGYAQVRVGEAAPGVNSERALEIQRFYVDHAWHGKGVAQRLMLEVERVANEQEQDTLWLGVWEKNPRAIAFYERCGFAKVGRAVFVLGSDRQNDFVMSRRLRAASR